MLNLLNACLVERCSRVLYEHVSVPVFTVVGVQNSMNNHLSCYTVARSAEFDR